LHRAIHGKSPVQEHLPGKGRKHEIKSQHVEERKQTQRPKAFVGEFITIEKGSNARRIKRGRIHGPTDPAFPNQALLRFMRAARRVRMKEVQSQLETLQRG
jgi:hypothetical protein